ncbi:exodeoxyribonuclease VII large subunit [Dongshaea marina]|uniref:exodeoxyribonuclease VII large subunit n=1 Tax=Dongshaea marina TaxID=2047966 RepID=UPI000D3ED731|nr:exodeoxyribonuclease VII large subunit [Dongshaea marina]
MQPTPPSNIYSVTRLNAQVRNLLEQQVGMVWLNAEISNLTIPASGHWYFTLKDSRAQVRAVMFRGSNRKVNFRPQNGQQLLMRARLTLYEPRGDYQLQVESMLPAGEGALQLQFEELKAKLAAEGLFAPERKQPLPEHPRRIGVITSPSGAAIRDILSVLARRDPSLEVTIYPAAVQGSDAPAQLRQAIEAASRHGHCDLLLLSRGGGSLEDLFCFNDEGLARSIASCPLPIVSAVGHEIDFTISDFVADLRAPTPSAAAEQISKDSQELRARLSTLTDRLRHSSQHLLRHQRQSLELLQGKLQARHPINRLKQQSQKLDELSLRLSHLTELRLQNSQHRLTSLAHRLLQKSPVRTLEKYRQQLSYLGERLPRALELRLEEKKQRLLTQIEQLQLVSPLATLGRGYAIAYDSRQQIIRSVEQVSAGDPLDIQLADGRLNAQIRKVLPHKVEPAR